ncbi:unnamed protein product [Alopecurus aequalis]
MDSLPVPGELMAEIFLRLPNPADLVRASAACGSFRRLVGDRSFLRQYRKLHGLPILGFLCGRNDFKPTMAPHPSAPAASAIALAADFSFSFLPHPACNWGIRDIRDGRVLLVRGFVKVGGTVKFKEIVVCDPLHRQYLLLPPIPDELCREVWMARHIFLFPPADSAGEEEIAEEKAFRVIYMARQGDKLIALVFSSSTRQWVAGPSHSWRDSFDGLLSKPGFAEFSRPQYVCGSFYWVTDRRENLLVFDTQRMEFYIADAPSEAKDSASVDIAFVEAGEGRARVFVRPKYTNDLNYSIRQKNCGSSSQWQFERTVLLDFSFSVMGSAGRHLFLFGWGSNSSLRGYFSLDVKTFQLEMLFASNSRVPCWHTYSNFPPSLLSTPTISSGKLPAIFICNW